MKVGSLFTGIGGFDLALERVGMRSAWQVEIDAKCNQTLSEHWPQIARMEDIKDCGRHNLESVDVVAGGFPCQDLSVAGKRAGLAGARSGLWHHFHRILAQLKPSLVVVENVPGLLSSNRGNDFATVIRGLVELGYGVCWRVLNAQYFGVPQRRRRVFIVGSLGTYRCLEVLFESESMQGNPAKSGETGKEVAYSLRANPSHSCDKGDGGLNQTLVASTLRNRSFKEGSSMSGRGGEDDFNLIASSLDTMSGGPDDNSAQANHLVAGTVSAKWAKGTGGPSGDEAQNLVNGEIGIRRLTPVECERLQGFPDDWTAMHADTVRYRQLGNAIAVPVAEWIGTRIIHQEQLEPRP
jgi:DNA (cytosine-5)-methyltransferase 1